MSARTRVWHGWTVLLPIVGKKRRFIAYGEKPWADAEIGNDWRRWGVLFLPTRKAAREYARTMIKTKGGVVARATMRLTVARR